MKVSLDRTKTDQLEVVCDPFEYLKMSEVSWYFSPGPQINLMEVPSRR